MQVAKIRDYLLSYRSWQCSAAAKAFLPYWETQQNWQQHFDLLAPDFAASYRAALSSQTSRRHYSRRAYEPKIAFLEMIAWETELVRVGLEDLLLEKRSLEGRLQRFGLYCNELFEQYRQANPSTSLPDHYHGEGDDYHMATLYLSCQYPALYAPYSTPLLQKCLKNLGAQNIPVVADVARFMKLLGTLQKFVATDPVIMQQHQAFLRPQDYQGESALLVWHWMHFVAASGTEA